MNLRNPQMLWKSEKKAKMTINNPTIIVRNTTPEKVLWTPHHLFYLESA